MLHLKTVKAKFLFMLLWVTFVGKVTYSQADGNHQMVAFGKSISTVKHYVLPGSNTVVSFNELGTFFLRDPNGLDTSIKMDAVIIFDGIAGYANDKIVAIVNRERAFTVNLKTGHVDTVLTPHSTFIDPNYFASVKEMPGNATKVILTGSFETLNEFPGAPKHAIVYDIAHNTISRVAGMPDQDYSLGKWEKFKEKYFFVADQRKDGTPATFVRSWDSTSNRFTDVSTVLTWGVTNFLNNGEALLMLGITTNTHLFGSFNYVDSTASIRLLYTNVETGGVFKGEIYLTTSAPFFKDSLGNQIPVEHFAKWSPEGGLTTFEVSGSYDVANTERANLLAGKDYLIFAGQQCFILVKKGTFGISTPVGNSVKVFPNPVSCGHTVTIALPDFMEHATCTVTDMAGKVVTSFNSSTFEILSPGYYIVTVQKEDKILRTKLSVQ